MSSNEAGHGSITCSLNMKHACVDLCVDVIGPELDTAASTEKSSPTKPMKLRRAILFSPGNLIFLIILI